DDTTFPVPSIISVAIRTIFPSAFSIFVSTRTDANVSVTKGVVTYVPHTGTCTLSVTITCTFRYRPAPGYQRDDCGLFSKRTATKLSFPEGFMNSVTSQ